MEKSHLAYAGIPTFWRCEHTQEISGADIVVMGVPFDVGTSNRPGARLGPRAIREMSLHTGNFHYPWSYDVREVCKIVDYGDVGLGIQNDIVSYMFEDTYNHAKFIFDLGAKLLTLGGDHTIPYGMIRAAKEKFGKLALLHFDSHQDSVPSEGNEIFHGTFAYDLVKENCIDPEKSVQVYIRTNLPNCGYNIIYSNEAMEMKPVKLAERIKSFIGDLPVYLTFDIDSLDPAYAPGTGTPVVGGPSTHHVRSVLWHLQGLNIVAADLVEVAPMYDISQITSNAAASIAGDLIYLMSNHVTK